MNNESTDNRFNKIYELLKNSTKLEILKIKDLCLFGGNFSDLEKVNLDTN